MKSFLRFLIVFFTILLTAAVLAPVIFYLQRVPPAADFLASLEKFGLPYPFKFEKIFNRIVILGILFTIITSVRIKKETLLRYGMTMPSVSSVALLLRSFVAGLLVLSIADGIKIFLGIARFLPADFTAFQWGAKLAGNFFAALLIGCLEEFFFRGFIYHYLKDHLIKRVWASIFITSAFYSIVHFIGDKAPYVDGDPSFFDSLRLIGAPFTSLANWSEFWPGAVGLFLFGLVLNDLILRTHSLYPCIGLHAGCVFFIKTDGSLVDFMNHQSLFWGSSKTYDGILGWIFLISLSLVLRTVIADNASAKKLTV